jgi:hypothetical protein
VISPPTIATLKYTMLCVCNVIDIPYTTVRVKLGVQEKYCQVGKRACTHDDPLLRTCNQHSYGRTRYRLLTGPHAPPAVLLRRRRRSGGGRLMAPASPSLNKSCRSAAGPYCAALPAASPAWPRVSFAPWAVASCGAGGMGYLRMNGRHSCERCTCTRAMPRLPGVRATGGGTLCLRCYQQVARITSRAIVAVIKSVTTYPTMTSLLATRNLHYTFA